MFGVAAGVRNRMPYREVVVGQLVPRPDHVGMRLRHTPGNSENMMYDAYASVLALSQEDLAVLTSVEGELPCSYHCVAMKFGIRPRQTPRQRATTTHSAMWLDSRFRDRLGHVRRRLDGERLLYLRGWLHGNLRLFLARGRFGGRWLSPDEDSLT